MSRSRHSAAGVPELAYSQAQAATVPAFATSRTARAARSCPRGRARVPFGLSHEVDANGGVSLRNALDVRVGGDKHELPLSRLRADPQIVFV